MPSSTCLCIGPILVREAYGSITLRGAETSIRQPICRTFQQVNTFGFLRIKSEIVPGSTERSMRKTLPQTRPVTIHDVAARARVSKSTVSNVVRGVPTVKPALKAKVEQAIAELGYTPSAVARSLVARRTKTLGVTIPRLEPFYAEVLHGAETRAAHDGYHLLIGSTEIDRRAPDALLQRRVDGFLICGVLDEQVIRTAAGYGPVVLVDPAQVSTGYATVGVDGFLGAELAVRHLVALGHRRIAAVIESDLPGERQERVAGYRAALAAAGLPVDPELELRDRGAPGATARVRARPSSARCSGWRPGRPPSSRATT